MIPEHISDRLAEWDAMLVALIRDVELTYGITAPGYRISLPLLAALQAVRSVRHG